MKLTIKRLDHHGIVAGVIDDLNLVELIDQQLPQDEKQEISPGEAVKGMIMNGLGFSNRPLSLSPQFFTNLPMEHLFREGVEASHFNRHKLGRTLDQCHEFGCEALFSLLSHQACEIEQVDRTFHSLDSTSYSLTGRYDGIDDDTDEHQINITHGYSKDHRPDLKQVVQEMIVSQDGGVPLACKNWDGNSADTTIFKERAKALVKEFAKSEVPKFCVADSKLYHQSNAEFLSQIQFITLIPSTIKAERECIRKALESGQWTEIDENYKYHMFNLEHFGIKQRWQVVYSQAAHERAQKTLNKQVAKEQQALKKALFHLQAQRFACETDASKALRELAKTPKYHKLNAEESIAHNQYEGKGRPKKDAEIKGQLWQVQANITEHESAINERLEQKSCFVLATNADSNALSDEELLQRYKAQSSVERGFRFLKDPLFFVSSLFIKKPSRIDALLMIMTLSLLIYSVAQRRLRAQMGMDKASIPNQINQPTQTPTLRWVFQCFEGINVVQFKDKYNYDELHIDGMDDVRQKVIHYLGDRVTQIYKNQNYRIEV